MTDKWLPAVMVIQALSAVFALQTLGSLAQPLVMATGDTRLLSRRSGISFCASLPWSWGFGLGDLPGWRSRERLRGSSASSSPSGRPAAHRHWLPGTAAPQSAQPGKRWSHGRCRARFPFGASIRRRNVRVGFQPRSQIAIGAIAFIGAQLVQWNLMRRPEGPETELIALCKRL
jgi:hypothetical protein